MVEKLLNRNSDGNKNDTFCLDTLCLPSGIAIARSKTFNDKNRHINLRDDLVK